PQSMTHTHISASLLPPPAQRPGSMLSFHRQHKWSVHSVAIILPYRRGHYTPVPCVLPGHPLSVLLALHRPMRIPQCTPTNAVEVPHTATRIACIESTVEDNT